MDLPHNQNLNLYITHLEKEGPFLKIWGQQEKSSATYVEQFLVTASPQFELGVGKMTLESMHVGTLVCAKYKDNKYYRARIINISFLHEGFVEVTFLDYGNKDVVPCANVRSLQTFPTSLISVPPLAIGFIFAEAHCIGGGQWNESIFEAISKELKYRDVQCTLLAQATQYYLIKLFLNNTDLCNVLIQRSLMQPISLQAQQAVMLSMAMQKQQQSQQPVQQTAPSSGGGLNTYKACTLEPGCLYPVYVSYVNDGPCHFSVQLKQSEDVLVILMKDINSITLRPLEDVPIPGTICLARCQEDGNICRAVVTNEVDNQFKVFYVDFGNYEVVPLESLYQIPFKYVLPKVMAIRFSLDGVEKSTVTLEMQCAFKKFVDNRLLHMKVLPSAKRMAIPKCELWDPESKTSALDVVNRAARHAYPEPISLNRGFSQPVKISYVYSCNRFYVQLVSKETELASLMQELQQSCQVNDYMDPGAIKVGLPCCALFEDDGQWYRAEIVEITGSDSIKVRYIDYGNEAVVPIVQLKIIDGEQLTVLRPQAIECCLNGYQNMSEDPNRDSLLEELILEGTFTMKVVEMLQKKALVELYDESNYNVASLLLDKLAAATSQVSPMLAVQAGNKIDLRKSPHVQNNRDQGFRGDRKSGRENNRNFNNTNDKNEKSWRHDKEPRNYDKNENLNARSSWRENNKGFSPKHRNKERNNPSTDGWNSNSPQENNTNNSWNDTTTPVTDNWESTQPQQNNFDKPKGRYDKRETFAKPQDRPERGGFRSDRKDGGFRNDRIDGGFKSDRNDGGFRGDRNDGGFRSDRNDGGFKKRSTYKKDGDLSSSESEKSFQKGPRTSSRNDRGGGGDNRFRKNDAGGGGFGGRQRDGGGTGNRHKPTSPAKEDSWNVSAVTTATDAAPVTAKYKAFDVVGTESNVAISWFHNPAHFYCQLIDCQGQFKKLMEEIQLFYKGRSTESSVVGAPVIGLFPEDNVLYRAQVLEVLGNEYKVFYIDFGNVSTINKIWPIEKKFMELPAQAIVCSLHGLKPIGDSWLDPDNYSLYFDKNTYMCRFVDKDESKTLVNLFYNDEDISQKLVSDGLAISTQAAVRDVELNLLLGQQFRGIVKSVNNLSDIIIALQCGLALSCSMHNLATAAETFEDVLRCLLEQTVIVYVDNIIDDKLEVTLYDNQGCKLVILNPDEGSYDTLDPICPMLVLSSTITGGVTHAEEGTVFIQPEEYTDSVAVLLEQLFDHYENLIEENTIIPETDQICAIHSEDSNWYRGKVLEFDDDKIIVQYIDYGNRETIGFGQLRELDPKFREMCTLSLQVTCNADGTSLIDKYVTANIFYGDNGWEGTVTPLEITPSTTTTSDTGFGTSSNQDNVEVARVTETVPQAVTKQTIGTEVFMSHVDSPNDFYLQLKESLADIEELQMNLQEEVKTAAELETPTAGVLCAAPYTADGEWYRAEVLDADDDITSVRFVDFGNTDVFNNSSTKMKSLPSNLLSLALYATRCTLNVVPPDGEWSSAAIERFTVLTMVEDLTAEFLDQDEKKNYVELFSEGKNVKDILIQENLAIPVTQSAETKVTGFVSHQNSPSEFWMQLENCIDELEWIAEQLSAAETFPELEDHSPGALCAALFPDDMMWYRARVLSNTVAGVELLFIDYGNSSASDGTALRKLPEELAMTPPLAQKCSLKKPEGLQHWSKRMAAKFAEISAEGQAIFTVKKLSTGETSIVELILDEKDVASLLLPETESAYVKDLVGLDNFRIKRNGETLPDTYSLEDVSGANWNEDALEKFKDINKEGTTTFQIEFLPDNTVCLYLNGRDIKYDFVPPKSPQKAPKTESVIEPTSTQDVDEVLLVEKINEDNIETEKTDTTENEVGSEIDALSKEKDEVHIEISENGKIENEVKSDIEILSKEKNEVHIDTSENGEIENEVKSDIETLSKEKNEVHIDTSENGEIENEVKSDIKVLSKEKEEVQNYTSENGKIENEVENHIEALSKQNDEMHIDTSEKPKNNSDCITGDPDLVESHIEKSATPKEANEDHAEASEEPKKLNGAHAKTNELPEDLANSQSETPKQLAEGHVKDVESIENNFHIEKDGETPNETYKLEQTEGSTFKEESTEILKGLSNEGRTPFQMEFLQENTVRLYIDGEDIRNVLQLDPTLFKNEVEAVQSVVEQEHKDTKSAGKVTEVEGFWSYPVVVEPMIQVAEINKETNDDIYQSHLDETVTVANRLETQNQERHTKLYIDAYNANILGLATDTSTHLLKREGFISNVEVPNLEITDQTNDQRNKISPDTETKTEYLTIDSYSVNEQYVVQSTVEHTNSLGTLMEPSNVNPTDTDGTDSTKNIKRRSKSSLSYDEKILPGCLSRSETPDEEMMEERIVASECPKAISEVDTIHGEQSEVKGIRSSFIEILNNDNINKQGELFDDTKELGNNVVTFMEPSNVDPTDTHGIESTKNIKLSRSPLNYDEKILPGCLSRSETPDEEMMEERIVASECPKAISEVHTIHGEQSEVKGICSSFIEILNNDNINKQGELFDDTKELGNNVVTFMEPSNVDPTDTDGIESTKNIKLSRSPLNYDEKILPGCLSRSETPDEEMMEERIVASECPKAISEVDTIHGEQSEVNGTRSSIEVLNNDDIKKQSELFDDTKELGNNLETFIEPSTVDPADTDGIKSTKNNKLTSRSPLNYDEKILPGCLSRSETPDEEIIEFDTIGEPSEIEGIPGSSIKVLNTTERINNDNIEKHTVKKLGKCGNENPNESIEQTEATVERGCITTKSDSSGSNPAGKDTTETFELNDEQSEAEDAEGYSIKDKTKVSIEHIKKIEDHSSTTCNPVETNNPESTKLNIELDFRKMHSFDHDEKVLPGYSRLATTTEAEGNMISHSSNKKSHDETMQGTDQTSDTPNSQL